MKKLILNSKQLRIKYDITILLFTEGTVLGPRTILEFLNVGKYVPIKSAVKKITKWNEQGANIIYLTSRKDPKEVSEVKNILLENIESQKSAYAIWIKAYARSPVTGLVLKNCRFNNVANTNIMENVDAPQFLGVFFGGDNSEPNKK